MLALTEEAEFTEYSPDLLQGILQNCLASLQAGKLTNAQERIEIMKQVMFARLRYIHNKVRSPLQRRRFYQIGLPISDCEEIERHQDALLALYVQATNYQARDSDARCLHLLKIAEFLLSLNELQPRNLESMNEDRVRILYLWLQGYTPQEMAEDFANGGKRLRADNISSYVDQVFDYKLPWGFNALGIYLNSLAEERAESISPITSYFPSLIKYGIHDVVASALLTFGLRSRKVALKVATNYRHDVESVSDILFWFLRLKRTELVLMGLSGGQIEAFLVAQKNAGVQTSNETRTKYVLNLNFLPDATLPSLAVGDSLFMQVTREEATTSFSVHTLSGITLGSFYIKESIPMSWQNPENIEVNIDNIQQFEGGQIELRVTVTEV